MSIAVVLNVVGIALNAVGVYLIFRFGLSPLIGKSGYVGLYSGKELADRNSEANKNKIVFFRRSITGLISCIFGALLQIVSIFL